MAPHLFIVIPAYNEEQTVEEVVRAVTKSLLAVTWSRIIVVDDGSTDHTADNARQAGAIVLRHPINRGLGAALSTGITGALRLGADCIVTLDGDGQHDPAEIPKMIEPIIQGKADVVIGSRFLLNSSSRPERSGVERSHAVQGVIPPLARGGMRSLDYARDDREGVPFLRKLANFFGNFFTWLLFGIWVSDSQSGFRAFSGDAAQKLQLRTSTMEVSSEIIREIARLKLRLAEVPITVRYTAYSLSKGQGFMRGLETLWKLIVLRFFR